MFQMTTSQIDKLGKRLTKEPISDVDLNLLDQYRLSFSDAYEYVVSKLHDAKFNVTKEVCLSIGGDDNAFSN